MAIIAVSNSLDKVDEFEWNFPLEHKQNSEYGKNSDYLCGFTMME